MVTQQIIKKIALAVITDGKIMMVRSSDEKEVFYTLGGKIEGNESDIDCLKREIKEEIQCDINESTLTFLEAFQDIAHGRENTFVNIKLYKGELIGNPRPSSEIAEIKYFDTSTDEKYLSSIAFHKIFPWLKEHTYIT